jgi:hypothetical protein
VTLLLLDTRQVVVRTARVEAPVDAPLASVTQLPMPRPAVAIRTDNNVLELLSEGLDLITVAAR